MPAKKKKKKPAKKRAKSAPKAATHKAHTTQAVVTMSLAEYEKLCARGRAR